MAKKGGAVALQIEVENDEEWEKLVERPGLILADVFSEWSGPCAGMTGNLRKVKLEIGGDVLTLALAKCDNITCLERFRNKSRPTWMFISNQRMIRLLFGANAPKLVSVLTEEIAKERRAIAERRPRDGIDFDQLTEEEQEIADEERRIREETERLESEARLNAINERRELVAQNLIEPMKEYNLVLVWHHVGNDGIAQIFNAIKESPMSVAGKQVKKLVTDEDLYEMLFYSTWEFTDLEREEFQHDEVTAMLFQLPSGDTSDISAVDLLVEMFYGAMKSPPGAEESLAMKLSTTVKVKAEPQENEEEEREEMPRTSSLKADTSFVKEPEHEIRLSRKLTADSTRGSATPAEIVENTVDVVIPGVYIPENDKCKVLALRIFYPNVTSKFDLPEPEPIPPHIAVAFDAFKKNEVLQLANEWQQGTMRYGFFTSAEADNAVLIAKTVEQFEKIVAPPIDSKLIVQVSKKKSEPLLSYCLLGPMYLSQNCIVGEKECEKFFPEGYDIPEPEEEQEEEVKKKKKRKRGSGSKTSVTSSGSKTSEDTNEGGSEEGLEEVAEDEEDEGELGDDDDILAGYMDPMDMDLMDIGPTETGPTETGPTEIAPTEIEERPPDADLEADKATATEHE